MRPDVAAAYDRMSAAARLAGLDLLVVSGFRSDAEQARLFAEHPDPRWVAPPGHSLHRCATELDLGPTSAYGWLASHAPKFGFLRRYSWEAWHFGYVAGPPPCSDAGNVLAGADSLDQEEGLARSSGLPSFVPGAYREALLRSASRERLAGPAGRPADGRVRLQPAGGLPRGCAGDRPVHALDRAELRPARSLRPRGGDRRPGAPDVRPAARIPLRAPGAGGIQRGLGRGRGLSLCPAIPGDTCICGANPGAGRGRGSAAG